MSYRSGTAACLFHWQRSRLYDQAAASLLHDMCAAARVARVEGVEGARKTKWAPVPLSTLEMQKRGSTVGISNQKILLDVIEHVAHVVLNASRW